MSTLSKIETWRGEHAGVQFKICNWEHSPMSGLPPVWNYYLYISEKLVGEKFLAMWLDDEIVTMPGSGREMINHDYFSLEVANVADLHGGITFYSKHGHSAGYRSIEIGCDYQHLYDNQKSWTLDLVEADARRSCDLVAEFLGIGKEKAAP